MARKWKTPQPAQVGQLAHRVIADLLSTTDDPCIDPTGTWRRVIAAVDHRMKLDGYRDRAARQTITAAALIYLEQAPAPPWTFVGAEVTRPGVRFDVLWVHAGTGELMVDEIKTGQSGVVLPSTRAQAERYLRALREDGHASARVRALSTRAPSTSWTLTSNRSIGQLPAEPERAPPPS
ncbi:hypothetical protein [Longivirga aurantiaca]|uniref:PD-(D/E)XK endonuclease-like domain-containing protein n=1 Tax=Longivirga aurantiaca TaxID=1837743 RepID=A0ABW1T175_9ACTN